MIFETFQQGPRTVYPVFLAGFHDGRALEGEVFLNPQQAYKYCENKVIHVKEVPFYSKEKALEFIDMKARQHVNHAKGLGYDVRLDQIECDQFREEVKKLLNE